MERDLKLLLKVILTIFISGALVMVFWNFTMPYLFGLKTVSYWQATALFLLVNSFNDTVSIEEE